MFNRNYYTIDGHTAGGWQFNKVEDGFTLIPNLGDLIEACGESNYFQLSRIQHLWSARIEACNRDVYADEFDTPEEAVCNLYLALHDKAIPYPESEGDATAKYPEIALNEKKV